MEAETKGDVILFFGCREKQKDFLYEDEMNEAVKAGHLSSLVVAFSREQTHKAPTARHCHPKNGHELNMHGWCVTP